eukprot:TRINITY_DN11422_c0_g1_i1.p1 TRINITY_DN11422_c0_g1~~TRINITY_DN11422_c0_g1_i1.p1  ORF type:complete len:446 (+),score=86.68 TRINITY_DN11422_c0_g1_i1:328-1665(+)
MVQAVQQFNVPVIAGMPLLRVPAVVGFISKVYRGQHQHFQMVLCNDGTRSLDDLEIKVTHPSFLTIYVEHEGQFDLIEFSTDGICKLGARFPIAAGHDLKLDITVTAMLTGVQHLEFLFKYSAARMPPEMPYRVCYWSETLEVMPLLETFLTVRPNFRLVDQYVATLEMKNVSLNPVCVWRVACLSSDWAISDLDDSKDEQCFIGPGQSYTVLVKVKPLIVSSGSLQTSFIWGNLSAEDELFTLNQVIQLLRRTKPSSQVIQVEGASYHLAISWSVAANARSFESSGDLFILRESVLNAESLAGCPVSVCFDCPREISHPFSDSSYLDVPIFLNLRATDPFASIQCIVECCSPLESFDSKSRAFKHMGSNSIVRSYFWKGKSKFVVQVSGRSTTRIELSACFTGPGVFNMNRLKFIFPIGEREVPQKFRTFFIPHQQFIQVHQQV